MHTIVDENDYTSNFTGGLRYLINSQSRTGLRATAQRVNPSLERRWGVDAAIVIKNGNFCKVAVFEAKWPRVSVRRDNWDFLERESRISHFHSQVERQHQISEKRAFVFEMFYCELPNGTTHKYMKQKGSTCITHDGTFSMNSQRHPAHTWKKSDLENLIKVENGGLHIGQIVESFAQCKYGLPMPLDEAKQFLSEYLFDAEVLWVYGSETELSFVEE